MEVEYKGRYSPFDKPWVTGEAESGIENISAAEANRMRIARLQAEAEKKAQVRREAAQRAADAKKKKGTQKAGQRPIITPKAS